MTLLFPRTRRATHWDSIGLALLLAWALVAPVTWGQPVMIARRAPSPSPGVSGTKPPPLVNAEEEYAGFLDKAEEHVRHKQYARAIEILQALIDRPDSGFIAAADGRQYSPLIDRANQVLGRMGEEGLKLYRRRYNPTARRLYEKALAEGDLGALRRLAQQYRWSDYGLPALEALASSQFDRGRFLQAQWVWRDALRMRKGTSDEPLLLLKVAVASHLSGDRSSAAQTAAVLRKKHPKARATLAGADRNLVAYLDAALKLAPPVRPTLRAEFKGWPGLAGVPDGMAVMSDSDVVLVPRWTVPSQVEAKPGDNISDKLLIGKNLMRRFAPNYVLGAELKKGLVQVSLRRGSSRYSSSRYRSGSGKAWLPPMLSPVVVDDLVICRQDDRIWAYDLLTGTMKWKSTARLQLEKTTNGSRKTHSPYYGMDVGEWGYQLLSVGGGHVYTVCNYAPPRRYVRSFGRTSNQQPGGDTSELAAISLKRQGALTWRVGGGDSDDGDEGALHRGKFLTAPTYHAGRLYVMSLYRLSYYLICLDADTGQELWSAMISQTPVINQRYGYSVNTQFMRGSPTAVSEGIVFVLTNAGAVAAFEAETGQPVWAYQYDSTLNQPGGRSYHPSSRGLTSAAPPNPLIVTGGKLIFAPVDSTKVLALSVDDGQPLWSQDRGPMEYLSAIDEDRFLLAGRGLVVRSTANGEELFGTTTPVVLGRPAVTPTCVMACAEDKIVRLRLPDSKSGDYRLATKNRAPRGLLGNLVSVDGKLLAANAAGLCAYFDYDYARQGLTQRIEKAPDAEATWQFTFQRGTMAFNAEDFARALADFESCRTLPGADEAERLSLKPWFYRTHVALGNRAKKPQDMLDRFRKAKTFAATDRQKAQMKIRIAKYYEQTNQAAKAIELAQALCEKSPTLAVADVPIGPKADDTARLGPNEEFPIKEWAFGKGTDRGFIGRTIAKHGRKAYAALDAQAKAEFDKAMAAKDPEALVELAQRWPHSLWADDARFRAAEIYYYQAMAKGVAESKANELLVGKVVPQLVAVSEMKDSPHRTSAAVALGVISARGGLIESARQDVESVRDQPPSTPVAFADIEGRLGSLLTEILGGNLPRFSSTPLQLVQRIDTPLTDIFQVKGQDVLVLRDQDYNPIRLGDRVLTLKENRAVFINSLANALPERDTWACLANVNLDKLRNYLYSPGRGLVCGLSTDRKTLLIADRSAVRGVSVATAKLAWKERSMSDIGISSLMYMGTGAGVLVAIDTSGALVCIDAGTGQTRWKAKLLGTSRLVAGRSRVYTRPAGPPKIAADCVFVRYNNFRSLACYDVVTGKVLRQWTATSYLDVQPTNTGMLAVMADGHLSVSEIIADEKGHKQFKKLWEKTYADKSYASILGVTRDKLAVVPGQTSNEVQVLAMARNRTIATFRARNVSGAAVPVEAYFDGPALYVVNTTGRYGRLSNVRGLQLEKYDLNTQKRLWSTQVSPAQRYQMYLMPLVIGKNHVVVSCKGTSSRTQSQVHVVDGRTGKVAHKIDLGGVGANVRLRMIGPPVMTNGRICVEDSQGLTVYGGQ